MYTAMGYALLDMTVQKLIIISFVIFTTLTYSLLPIYILVFYSVSLNLSLRLNRLIAVSMLWSGSITL